MPKETIHTSRHPGDHNFDVKVGWTRELDVQVGVSEVDERSMWWVYGEQYKDTIGKEVFDIVTDYPGIAYKKYDEIGTRVLNMLDTTCGSLDSLWATMDRKQINDLIRVLRRARDAAFGRDE